MPTRWNLLVYAKVILCYVYHRPSMYCLPIHSKVDYHRIHQMHKTIRVHPKNNCKKSLSVSFLDKHHFHITFEQ